jgi:phosphinothricin acetyltransferase
MNIIHCTYEKHSEAILEILNEAIENSTAVYDYKPRPAESMVGWFKNKEAANFPVIGIESDANELLGFSTFGTFRAWPAYKYTVEHSIYVHHAHRGKGLGSALLGELMKVARSRDIHVMVGGIDASNIGSIALHKKHGFTHAGTISQAGFKFGRWLDLAFYQATLPTPTSPVDG